MDDIFGVKKSPAKAITVDFSEKSNGRAREGSSHYDDKMPEMSDVNEFHCLL